MLPPELDPRGPRHARAAVRRERTTPPRWRRRALGWVAAAMALLVLGTSGAGYALLSYSDSRIKRIDDPFEKLPNRPEKVATDAVTYLIVGSDKREGLTDEQIKRLQVGRATADNGQGQRSDTMLLVHMSADRDRAVVVSLPRDSYVEIPAHVSTAGKQVGARTNKLNAAFAFGGPSLLVETVEGATGVRIDHYVEVNFAGFVGMVDAIDGVDICVPKAIDDDKARLKLAVGDHHLDGVDSLKYVRARQFDRQGDLGRMRRQQQFIGAMLREATSAGVLLNPIKLTGFVNAALDSVETDPGLVRDDVIALAQQLRDIASNKVVFATVPLAEVDYRPPGRPDLGSTVRWDDTLASKLFADLTADRPIAPDEKAADTKPAIVAEVPPAQVKVKVLNATATKGLAARAATDFTTAGFTVVGTPGNAPASDLTTTVIRYDPRWSKSVKTLQVALPGATLQEVAGLGGTFEVYLGSGYTGVSPVTVSTTPPGATGSTPKLETHTAAEKACG